MAILELLSLHIQREAGRRASSDSGNSEKRASGAFLLEVGHRE